jgi:hypothetical protein
MANPDLAIYPNFRWEGCWDCQTRDLCLAEEFGEDLDYIKRTRYERWGGYGTTKAQELTPQTVGALEELQLVRSGS